MVINKSAFLVLVLVSFGLLCSGVFAFDTEQDPRQQYEECQRQCERSPEQRQCEQRCEKEFRRQQQEQQSPREQYEKCQRRCEWETQGEQEQQRCEQKCEKQMQQREQEQGGRRRGHSHDMINPEDPQKRYEECQQRCEQKEQRQQPQCQRTCQQKLEKEQRQVQQCQERCERQEQGRQEKQQCQRRCQEQHQEQQPEQESRQKYQQCQERCQEQHQGQRQQQQCQRQCREEYQQEINPRWEEGQEEEEEEQQEQRNNPYFFPKRSFQTPVREEEGEFSILQRFAQKSRLFKGANIDDFRFVMWKANPNTFVLPHHTDSEAILFVTNGKGTVTLVTHENKESFNVERGHVVRIPAGYTVYMVNQDNQEAFTLAGLSSPVNTPGRSEIFFPAGNENPQSYFQVFSDEILETVFNTPRERLEQVFGGQSGQQKQREQRQQGLFRRASREQKRELSEKATSPRRKSEERLVLNLLGQSPIYSNQNGRFYEACPDKFQQLRNLDVAVAAIEINQGAIFVPHYNTEATFVLLVKEGNGYVEMACPHLSHQSPRRQSRRYQGEEEEQEDEQEEQRSGEFKLVRARCSTGDVIVVPAGHPVTYVASNNKKLKLIGFGINARNNQRIFVAGKKNMVRQMDDAAKELSFGVPARLVDEVFNSPDESYFVSPSKQRQEKMGNPLSSILDFARLF